MDRIKNTRSLNAIFEQISPASVEGSALLHESKTVMCLTMNGRDSKKYLLKTLPLLIRCCGIGLGQRQADISEQLNTVMGGL